MKYRVFDQKNNFHQVFDSVLQGAFSWARDCAKHVGGYVKEYTDQQFADDEEGQVVVDYRAPKAK